LLRLGPEATFPAMNTSDQVETAALRRMTPAEKVAVMTALWRQAWALTAAGIRARHPTWTDEQVANGVRELFRSAGT
jgi:hypothetical protein